jgi:hypothetical protein
MYRIIPILFFLISVSSVLNSQVKHSKTEIDSITYNLYQKSDWGTLISEAENAMDNGIDFYFLKMRLGIAYYIIRNYSNAVNIFDKIVSENPKDTIAQEYLYYSYIFLNRESEARVLSEIMPPSVRKRLNIELPKFINGIYTETGITANKDLSSRNKNNPAGQYNIYGEQKVFNNSVYYNASLSHLINNRISLFQSYNFIGVNSSKVISDSKSKRQFSLTAKQNEYYLNAKFNIGNGFELQGAIHYINLEYQDVLYKIDSSNITYPPFYEPVKETLNDYVLLISAGKYTGNFKFNFTNTFSQLNKAQQFQNQLSAYYFPLGNLNLYLISDFVLHTEKLTGESPLTTAVFQPGLGFKVLDFLWMEANYTVGKLYNFNEMNAFIVYNSPDKIKNRLGINFILPLSEKVELSIRYQFYIQEQSVSYKNTDSTYGFQILNNNIHKLIGGLKWTF